MNYLFFILVAVGSVYYLFAGTGIDPQSYINFPGFLIVLSGTLCAFLLSNSMNIIIDTFREEFINKKRISKLDFYQDLREFVEGFYRGELKPSKYHLTSNVIKYRGIGIDTDSQLDLIQTEIQSKYEKAILVCERIKNLGKYPPAFGMVGTVFSMVGVFGSLGGDSDPNSLGIHVATAMLSTLYGILLANIIILPFAEKIKNRATELLFLDNLFLQTCDLLFSDKSKAHVLERLNLYEKDN